MSNNLPILPKSRSKKSSQHADVIDRLDLTGNAMFHHDGPFDARAPSRNRHRTKAPMMAWTSAGADGGLYTATDAAAFSGQTYEPPKKKVDAIAEAWGIHEPEPYEEFFAGGTRSDIPASSIFNGKEFHGSKPKRRDPNHLEEHLSARRGIPPPKPAVGTDSDSDGGTDTDSDELDKEEDDDDVIEMRTGHGALGEREDMYAVGHPENHKEDMTADAGLVEEPELSPHSSEWDFDFLRVSDNAANDEINLLAVSLLPLQDTSLSIQMWRLDVFYHSLNSNTPTAWPDSLSEFNVDDRRLSHRGQSEITPSTTKPLFYDDSSLFSLTYSSNLARPQSVAPYYAKSVALLENVLEGKNAGKNVALCQDSAVDNVEVRQFKNIRGTSSDRLKSLQDIYNISDLAMDDASKTPLSSEKDSTSSIRAGSVQCDCPSKGSGSVSNNIDTEQAASLPPSIPSMSKPNETENAAHGFRGPDVLAAVLARPVTKTAIKEVEYPSNPTVHDSSSGFRKLQHFTPFYLVQRPGITFSPSIMNRAVQKKQELFDCYPTADPSPTPIGEGPDPPESRHFTIANTKYSFRLYSPDWILSLHHDWGWISRCSGDKDPLPERRKHDTASFLSHLLAEWTASYPGAFNNANGFGIHGSSFANAQNVHYTINNYWPAPTSNSGPSSCELKIQLLEKQLEDERTIREQNEARNERVLSDIRQSLHRLETRLLPGPEPPPNEAKNEDPYFDIREILHRLESNLPSEAGHLKRQDNICHRNGCFHDSTTAQSSSRASRPSSILPEAAQCRQTPAVDENTRRSNHFSRLNHRRHFYHPYGKPQSRFGTLRLLKSNLHEDTQS